MNKYTIVFCADENYIQHLTVAIVSLLENNKDCDFSIFVICSGISLKNFIQLERLVKKYQSKLSQVIVSEKEFNGFVKGYHFTKAIYYRLLIPKLVEDELVLYLDADIVVNDSIKKIFSIDLYDSYIAAVLNPDFKRHDDLQMRLDAEYFNSGVMLINNKMWRESKLTEKVISFIEINKSRVQFPDQDGLNSIINGNWLNLPLKFNQQAVIFDKNFNENCFTTDELQEAKKKPVIIHYTGSSKPWHFRNNHPYKDLYWKYLKMTPFKNYIPEDLTFVNIVKWCVPIRLKTYLKKIACR